MSGINTAIAIGGIAAGAILRALESGGQWGLISLDSEVPFQIVGRFPPREGIEVDVASDYAISQGLGDQGELVQWLAGRSDRISVGVELHDTTAVVPPLDLNFGADSIGLSVQVDDVKAEIEQLEALARKHPKLRRPPKCRFMFGSQWSRDVFVLGVSYTIRRVHMLSGKLAEVYVRLSMIQVVDTYLEETDPGAPEPESVEIVALDGDTHELIAARELGDPALGVYLRQRDTTNFGGILTSGSRVLVVDRDHPDMRGPDFRSAILSDDGSTFAAAYRTHIAARGSSRQVPQ